MGVSLVMYRKITKRPPRINSIITIINQEYFIYIYIYIFNVSVVRIIIIIRTIGWDEKMKEEHKSKVNFISENSIFII